MSADLVPASPDAPGVPRHRHRACSSRCRCRWRCARRMPLVRRTVPLMGTIAEVQVAHRDERLAEDAIDAALAELQLGRADDDPLPPRLRHRPRQPRRRARGRAGVRRDRAGHRGGARLGGGERRRASIRRSARPRSSGTCSTVTSRRRQARGAAGVARLLAQGGRRAARARARVVRFNDPRRAPRPRRDRQGLRHRPGDRRAPRARGSSTRSSPSAAISTRSGTPPTARPGRSGSAIRTTSTPLAGRLDVSRPRGHDVRRLRALLPLARHAVSPPDRPAHRRAAPDAGAQRDRAGRQLHERRRGGDRRLRHGPRRGAARGAARLADADVIPLT